MALEAADLTWASVALRLAVGASLGLVVGFERELDGHEAGARTHALLALGAALFGAISVGAFGDFLARRNATNLQVDVTRVASYVAAGIGFLGAGAILKRDGTIKGLTTAASLWVAASVGLAAGLGFWAGAVGATALTLAALVADRPMRRWHLRSGQQNPDRLVVRLAADDAGRAAMVALVEDLAHHAAVTVRRATADAGGATIDVHVEVHTPEQRATVLAYAARPGVREVTREAAPSAGEPGEQRER